VTRECQTSSSNGRQRNGGTCPAPSNCKEGRIAAPLGLNASLCMIKDVARLAPLSTATTSRIVNDSCGVSGTTTKRVLAAISEVQFSPGAHVEELGRANGGIQRRRHIQVLALARRELKSGFGSQVTSQDMFCGFGSDFCTRRVGMRSGHPLLGVVHNAPLSGVVLAGLLREAVASIEQSSAASVLAREGHRRIQRGIESDDCSHVEQCGASAYDRQVAHKCRAPQNSADLGCR